MVMEMGVGDSQAISDTYVYIPFILDRQLDIVYIYINNNGKE